MDERGPITTWSASRTHQWRTCRRQFLLGPVLRAQPAQPDATSRLIGRIGHGGIQAAYETWCAESSPARWRALDGRTMIEFFSDAYAAMERHPDTVLAKGPDWKRVVQDVFRTLSALPIPHPDAILGVEKGFSISLWPSPPRKVNGVIDLILRTGFDSLHIRDWKQRDADTEPHRNVQLAIYVRAAQYFYPWAKNITVGLYGITTQRETVVTIPPDALESLLGGTERDCRAALTAVEELSNGRSIDQLFPAASGEHCTRCTMRSYCPLFANADLPVRPGVDVNTERERNALALANLT